MKKQIWYFVFGICFVVSISVLGFLTVGCGTGVDELPTTTIAGGTTTTVAGGTTTTVAGGTTTTVPGGATTSTTTTTVPDYTWTQATSNAFSTGGRDEHSSAVFNGKLWVIAGSVGSESTNEVWSSLDGSTWTLEAIANFPSRRGQTCLVYNGKIWLIGGDTGGAATNEVWSSTDAKTWTLVATAAAFPARETHSSVVFDNKMWVIAGSGGGLRNDVWYSDTTGVTWAQATVAANFSARKGHGSVVLDNGTGLKMWVFGGETGSNYQDDTWYSSNGVNWTQAGTVKTAGVSPVSDAARLSGNAVTYEANGVTRAYVMAGRNDGAEPYLHDLRYSANGTNWTCVSTNCAYSGRREAACVVFNNKIWLIGGNNGSNSLNDIWYSPK